MSRSFSREDLDDAVLNPRLEREQARTGTITASLLWNGPSDLDLHAVVKLSGGKSEHIYYESKQGTGGTLDVDANARDTETKDEPVENIYWDKPPEGEYTISVHHFKQRSEAKVPFRVVLKLPEEILDYEGALVKKQSAKCFNFAVDGDRSIRMGKVASARIIRKPSTMQPMMATTRAVKAMKALKPLKVMTNAMKATKVIKKPMKPMKVSTVARGKLGKAQVFKGLRLSTSGGLKKEHLMLNKEGKVVSKRSHAAGVKSFQRIKAWMTACNQARSELGIVGFSPVKNGTPFYAKALELYQAERS